MQQKTESQSCVITDANILINFIKLGRVDILQQLRMYAFYLSEEVYTLACSRKRSRGFHSSRPFAWSKADQTIVKKKKFVC